VIGTLLNRRFRLEEQIGSGGMSTVYRAFDETLERWVAIKLMHRALSDDPLQLERCRTRTSSPSSTRARTTATRTSSSSTSRARR
jgi:serine/threonine protein kinase